MTARSPFTGAECVMRVVLLCNGHDVTEPAEILSVTIGPGTNREPTASIGG